MARLRRADPSAPGILRVRRGRGFSYLTPDGDRLGPGEDLDRIRELVIPPAWKDVWICDHPRGHIQATGYDEAGRKQYLYHPAWREHRDREKFERMLGFAAALGEIRARSAADLELRGLVRDRVLACAIGLLDIAAFRIGGEEYALENGSYGVATLEKGHLSFARGAAIFDYPAKSGQRCVFELSEPSLLPTLRALKRRSRGTALLAYYEGREWVDLRSEHINEQIKALAGEEYSAKDFRTWNATVFAAVEVAVAAKRGAATKTARKRLIREAIESVAELLGNTPAIARSSYIDPRVFDHFEDGITIADALPADLPLGKLTTRRRARIEAAVVDMLGS